MSVGMKIAIALRFLATGESYTSLHYQFRTDKATISKFILPVCRAIKQEFLQEYLTCPTTPEEWQQLETEFRLRWNVPHAIGALDGKHVTIRKPPKSGSLYHNYKGFFSIVLLALVDAVKLKGISALVDCSVGESDIRRENHDSKIRFSNFIFYIGKHFSSLINIIY